MRYLFVVMLFIITLAMNIQAQTVVTTVNTPVVTTTVQTPLPVKTATTVVGDKVNAEIIAASSTKVVKGAPFSAEGVSESVQVLADGNKITRSTTSKMYRDGEGRFRREGAGSGNGGALTPMPYGTFTMFYNYDAISIFDPVAGIRYSLNPTNKTARSYNVKDSLNVGGVYVTNQMTFPSKSQVETTAAATATTIAPKTEIVVMPGFSATMTGGKTEQLGTKTFEGVEAEGTRTVTTIEAGKIGNERPIEIVYERWFSKELDLIVYSRHYDPRHGEQIYRLTNIDRGEPDRSLFVVPSDYKITVESSMKFFTTTPVPTSTKQQ